MQSLFETLYRQIQPSEPSKYSYWPNELTMQAMWKDNIKQTKFVNTSEDSY